MGLGSSRQQYEPKRRRQSPGPGSGRRRGKKRRRGFFRKTRPVPTTQPVIPIRQYSHHRHLYGSGPYVPPRPFYAPPQPIYPASIPQFYNNYAAPSYISPRQPMMMPPQQFQAMMAQTAPQSQPMMMPQQVPQYQPGVMPQQVPQGQPMMMPQQVSPYMFSPYMISPPSMGTPLSTPYVQQQPLVQPMYNNAGVSAPVSMGMVGPTAPYSSSYQRAFVKLSTDWTGGGQISPGFLGPPI